MNSGSISSMARGIGRWHCGQARVRQVIPRASIASPSSVNRLGRNRCCRSGPSSGSPSRSMCSEIQRTSSGAKPLPAMRAGHLGEKPDRRVRARRNAIVSSGLYSPSPSPRSIK